MLPLKLLRNPIVSFAAVSSVMSYGGLFVIIIYLPLWFQAAKGASPLDSGIYYLPTVITTTLGTVASGIFGSSITVSSLPMTKGWSRLTFTVSKLGYYTPFMIIGSAIAAIAAGLMSTLTPSSTNAAWICYQLLNGVARGLMSQQPITAVQANLSKEHLSIGTALIVFSQNFGASLFISLGQMTFGNSLLMNLAKFAPEVDAEKTFGAGATLFRTVIPKSSLLGVLLAYNKALTTTFVSATCLI